MSRSRYGTVAAQTQRLVLAPGVEADLQSVVPAGPLRAHLLWLPALGVPARHYLPLAEDLAGHGIAVWVHEWRGNGSSSVRASRHCDWGYAELLVVDIPASLRAVSAAARARPVWLGGHSLGGQLAILRAAMGAPGVGGLALVGSGIPWWRVFPERWKVALAALLIPAVAGILGHFPGRRIGFGGREARGVMADWGRIARSGLFQVPGAGMDLEQACRALRLPITALVLADDWLAPRSALDALLAKAPDAPRQVQVLSAGELGVPADHFAWMKAPHAVAGVLAGSVQADGAPLYPSGG